MIRVAIVDDHAIVRAGLRQFFSEQVDLRVTGEAANGREAVDLVRRASEAPPNTAKVAPVSSRMPAT